MFRKLCSIDLLGSLRNNCIVFELIIILQKIPLITEVEKADIAKKVSQFLDVVEQDSRDNDYKPSPELKESFVVAYREKGLVLIKGEAWKIYSSLPFELYKILYFRKKIERAEIKQYLLEVAEGYIYGNISKKQATEIFLKKLDSPVLLWTVYIPVTGFESNLSQWPIGDCVIFEKRALSKKLKIRAGSLGSITELRVKHYIEIKVEAVDSDVATKMAREKAEVIFGVLNFYCNAVGFATNETTTTSYGTRGEKILAPTIFLKTKKLGMKYEMCYSLAGFMPLMLEAYQFTTVYLPIEKVNTYLKNYKTNDAARVIINALKWIGRGTLLKSDEEAFVDYAIAIESLITANRKEDRHKVGKTKEIFEKRLLHVLQRDGWWSGGALKLAQRFTSRHGNTRGKILHVGTDKNLMDLDTDDVRRLANFLVTKVLKSDIIFKDIVELRQWIEPPKGFVLKSYQLQ